MKYNKVAVGGTFDELHRGHKILLKEAFEIGDSVVIGLSSDELVSKLHKPHITANYCERRKMLNYFLKESELIGRAEIIPLFDAYGSTLKDAEIEALVVSEETEPTAGLINNRRKKAGLPPFEIVAIKMVPSQNCRPISTTRIRRGEMDREGHLLKEKEKNP